MSTHTNNITLRSSAAISSAGTTYSSIFRVDRYDELNLFLIISAQTGYSSGDTLAVSVQIVGPDGNYIDLGNPSDFDFIIGRPDVSVSAWVKANLFAKLSALLISLGVPISTPLSNTTTGVFVFVVLFLLLLIGIQLLKSISLT